MALSKKLSLICSIAALLPLASASILPFPFATSAKQKTLEDNDDTPLPLVIWHGLGDSFANPSLRDVAALAESVNPGTLVYTIALAPDANGDRSATFLGNVTEQIAQVCARLAAHPILSTAPAIDALGFSQGGQFLRGYVQRCNYPPVRSLVTFGAQHNGIVDFRSCGPTDWVCKGAMALLRGNTWSSFVQSRLVPAQYYRDPEPAEYEKYLEHSNFLADINNERVLKNKTYVENLKRLENFVMYMFEDDTVAIPKESAWFEEVNGTETTPLRARPIYKEDWIGLKELDRKGGLTFKTTPGEHMQLDDKVLKEAFKEYFGVLKKGKRGQRVEADL
ncbi:Alpha/Beta hydrolase protein [Coniochaeta sp. 2T2.1]|nr:Alpha/Beta hydrolase protein [Coniochaeta sp. 2T2.1]